MTIQLDYIGGGKQSLSPEFSLDGNYLYVSRKNTIISYSVSTGHRIIEYKGLKANIVGFSVHTYNSNECITACSETGEIITWKTSNSSKVFHNQFTESVQIILSFDFISAAEETLTTLISFQTKKSRIVGSYDVASNVFKMYYHFAISSYTDLFLVKSSQDFFCVVSDNILYFVKTANIKKFTRQNHDDSREITCMTCHPSQEIVIVGDQSGRILLYKHLFGSRPVYSVYHWHTLPVQCLTFSANGNYFFSGGAESVLVKWNVDTTQQKQFVPRLGSDLTYINTSRDNAFVAVTSADNLVRIFDTSLNQVQSIQYISITKLFQREIVYDEKSRSLILNGKCGFVQFYSPKHNTVVRELDVVLKNRITAERDCTIENLEVIQVSISKNGQWLATVEERNDLLQQYEIRLKFWFLDDKNPILNTLIEFPHKTTITNLQFSPSTFEKCVTVGSDKCFKVWTPKCPDANNPEKKVWQCDSFGFFRELDCEGLSFLIDGSLLAVGFDTIITLWTVDPFERKKTITHPCQDEPIKYLCFGQTKKMFHLLIATTPNQILVWNANKLTLKWTVQLHVSLLIPDYFSKYCAVISTDQKVYIFSPESSDIIFMQKLSCKKKQIIAGAFVPKTTSNKKNLKWNQVSNLYLVNSDNEMFRIGKEDFSDYDIRKDDIVGDKSVFMLPAVRNKVEGSDLNPQQINTSYSMLQALNAYLQSPLQTMVPVKVTSSLLLQSMIVENKD